MRGERDVERKKGKENESEGKILKVIKSTLGMRR